MPVRLVRRGLEALRALVVFVLQIVFRLVSLTLRIGAVLLVVASLVVGLSYVPQVRARVPAAKQVTAIAKQWLQRAEDWGSGLLASLRREARPPRRTSRPAATSRRPATTAQRPAATAQKPAPVKPVATQPLTVRSTPTGATIQLNARQVGKTPLTLKVAPGTYKVTITRPGYVTMTRTITVKTGSAALLNVTLIVASKPPSQIAPTPSPSDEGPER